jgi:NADPH:quinone reductase-like Zn-dependent oxidoreductase
MVPHIPDTAWPTFPGIVAGMGEHVDGTLAERGVFHESCLVRMPTHLDYVRAATLTCSALTAWNALFGTRGVRRGEWVLVMGTGGVSVAALQVGGFLFVAWFEAFMGIGSGADLSD